MALTVKMLGISELSAEFTAIQQRVDLATLAATKKAQSSIVKNVRKNMRGKPRWNHRGKSSIYPADIDVQGMPRNVPRGGGPGQLTGMLAAGVGGKKRPVSALGVVTGGVGVGGSRLRSNNLKKGLAEQRYPFFAPGVAASTKDIADAYALAWKKAIG